MFRVVYHTQKIDMLLLLKKQYSPVGTLPWEHVEAEFTTNNSRPQWNNTSQR